MGKNMFLHLGNDVYISEKDIIMIGNLDTATVSRYTKSYLEKCEKAHLIETVCTDIPKTFVVSRKKDKDKVYLTNISSGTLVKRSENSMLI